MFTMNVTKAFGFIFVLAFLANVSGQSILQCTRDYINGATRITDVNEICDLSKTYLRCVFRYYRDNGITLTSSQRSQLKEQVERAFSQANVQCDESVDEMIRFAESGRLPDSEERTTQSIVDVLRSTTDTNSGQSILRCTRDYINAATRITDANEICDLSKTYLRCVFKDLTLTPAQRSQLKTQLEETFRKANVQCDESVDEMIRFAESGSGSGGNGSINKGSGKNGSIKVSGNQNILTLLAAVMPALMLIL